MEEFSVAVRNAPMRLDQCFTSRVVMRNRARELGLASAAIDSSHAVMSQMRVRQLAFPGAAKILPVPLSGEYC
jgi:hypothetical protein